MKWVTHKDNIIREYNSTEHSITQIKPNEAGNKNHRWINLHLNAAKKNRTHPDINDGDMMWYKLKPSFWTKRHEAKWNSTRQKVIGNLTNNQYFIPNRNKSKMWLRHELLKIC